MAGRPKTFDPDQVLQSALDLFWVQGYEATSVRDLLDHMKISWQSLYDTYGNKHELFIEALKRYDREAFEQTRAALEAPGSPLGHVRQMVRTWGERVAPPTFYGCFINNAAVELSRRDGEVAQIVLDHLTALEQLLKEALDRAVEANELAQDTNTRALARFLTTTCHGLIVMGKAGKSDETVQDVVDVTLTLLA